MSTSSAFRLLEPEEAAIIDDAEAYELVDGVLEERPMSVDAVWIAGEVFAVLRAYAQAHGGHAFADGLGLRLWPGSRRFRRPDACYFAHGRLAAIDRSPLVEVAPDVVVEVLSPGDDYRRFSRKCREYLEAGVRAVWAIDPDARELIVRRRDGPAAILREYDVLSGEPELPGFRCELRTLFPPGETPNG